MFTIKIVWRLKCWFAKTGKMRNLNYYWLRFLHNHDNFYKNFFCFITFYQFFSSIWNKILVSSAFFYRSVVVSKVAFAFDSAFKWEKHCVSPYFAKVTLFILGVTLIVRALCISNANERHQSSKVHLKALAYVFSSIQPLVTRIPYFPLTYFQLSASISCIQECDQNRNTFT